jgi:FKBP-type peptidyl-prolyl cis-trans isomerase FkpA
MRLRARPGKESVNLLGCERKTVKNWSTQRTKMKKSHRLSAPFGGALAAASFGILIVLCTLGFSAKAADVVTTLTGLKIIDNIQGSGASPKRGQRCVINYIGWLYVNGAKNSKFDSSFDHGRPFEFFIGKGEVIKGWDEGVATMKVGGNRTLIVPPELGYGAHGLPSRVPANAWLIFDIDLVGVK